MRASKSATGSVKLILFFSSYRHPFAPARAGEPAVTDCPKPLLLYQDDLETPGISPFGARPRKHRRQRPNLRRYARGRPQMLQRLRCWVENLGFLLVLAIFAVVAMLSFCKLLLERHSHLLEQRPGLV